MKKMYRTRLRWAVACAAIGMTISSAGVSPRAAERTEAVDSRRHSDASEADRFKIYDEDPEHPWNRVYRLFFIRESAEQGSFYGVDELDPLIWPTSDYFLIGEGFERAKKVLDDLLRHQPEPGPESRIKRALMQRDLWAVFDWLVKYGNDYPEASRSLKVRLARAIRDLALSREEIEDLPDNYFATWQTLAVKASRGAFDAADPNEVDLPYDLLDPRGDWIALWNDVAIANVTPVQAAHVSGRSQFWALIMLPEGRRQTLEYLNRLKNPWNIQTRSDLRKAPRVRPRLPQIPQQTEVALVRQMVLIDREGELVPSPLIESVQLRRFLTDPDDRNAPADGNVDIPRSTFIEYRLSHRELALGTGPGLTRTPDGDVEYALFETHPNDPFRISKVGTPYAITPEPIYGRCTLCHSGRGISSIQSSKYYIPRPKYPPREAKDISFEVRRITSFQKQTQYDWGVLKGMIEAMGGE